MATTSDDQPADQASPPSEPARQAESGLGVPLGANGILAGQHLRRAIDIGVIASADDTAVPESNVQPASLDLRLGPVAYRVRCSFLPGVETVEEKMKGLVIDELDLRDEGAVLETGLPYVIPLGEALELPAGMRGKTNPKSSTGRLDVFTRVITDGGFRFDEIAEAYRGPLWLEVVPLSFPVRVRQGISLNQLRLAIGKSALTDDDIRGTHRTDPLLYEDGEPVPDDRLAVANGLFVNLDLRGNAQGRVGYRARRHVLPVDMSKTRAHQSATYWEPVFHEPGDRIVLEPEGFYLLLSRQAVRIPPTFAAEMTAFDPTSGELRTHYAGFFDPGFGHDPEGRFKGSRAALEIRAHDVPFMIEHLQRVCKLTFETMIEAPDTLYGQDVGSNYQGQVDTLSKHFIHETPPTPPADQNPLFDGND